ncbi:hypothetical protein [Deinococcus navajonensis]|uniref:Uncharacterized protein n=1 Tax=Deinococcus navajonensis TaxID=309884 RepID=A0ABV8XH39_9DEIO
MTPPSDDAPPSAPVHPSSHDRSPGTDSEFGPEVQAFLASRQDVQSRVEALGFDCTGSGGGLGNWDLEFQNEQWLAYVDYTGGTEPQPGQFQLPGSGGEYSVRLRPLSDDSLDDDEEGVLSTTVHEVEDVLSFLQQHLASKEN